mgnify:CR=1 FL=1|jgi:hypothetical protein|tara:strand:- start:3175 stop:3990 length:816 start_codon:yes stop_codon:yes gene_type:complete
MKHFKKSLGISLVALFLIVGGAYALTITGSPQEVRELVQNEGMLGSGGVVVDSPPADINSSLTPTTNNTYDIGTYALSWKDIYASGTLYLGTLDVGSVTINEILNADLNVTNAGRTATTTIAAGTAGNTTSTFAGDVDIASLFLGLFEFPLDAGVVDAFDIPISPAAANTTREGYAFLMDGYPLLTLIGQADGSGAATSTGVGIRTQYPSSTLHVANDYFDKANNPATSTLTIGVDNISPGCLKMQDTNRAGWTYLTVIDGVATYSQTSCE